MQYIKEIKDKLILFNSLTNQQKKEKILNLLQRIKTVQNDDIVVNLYTNISISNYIDDGIYFEIYKDILEVTTAFNESVKKIEIEKIRILTQKINLMRRNEENDKILEDIDSYLTEKIFDT